MRSRRSSRSWSRRWPRGPARCQARWCSTARSWPSMPPACRPGSSACRGASTSRCQAIARSAPSQTPAEQPTALIAFDLLRDGDIDWRAQPLRERRRALEARCAALGSSAAAAEPPGRRRRPRALRRSATRGLGRAAREARRLAVSRRKAQPRVAQAEDPATGRVRHRRLDRSQAARVMRFGALILGARRRRARWSTSATSAPASPEPSSIG